MCSRFCVNQNFYFPMTEFICTVHFLNSVMWKQYSTNSSPPRCFAVGRNWLNVGPAEEDRRGLWEEQSKEEQTRGGVCVILSCRCRHELPQWVLRAPKAGGRWSWVSWLYGERSEFRLTGWTIYFFCSLARTLDSNKVALIVIIGIYVHLTVDIWLMKKNIK